jgi:predicted acylesterase/phospholipase RssA
MHMTTHAAATISITRKGTITMKAVLSSTLGSLLLMAALVTASCSHPSRIDAVPTDIADKAVVLALPSARSWEYSLSDEFMSEIVASATREIDLRTAAGQTGPLPPANYLAISGGGADGAYGAGLLSGWTALGTRPEFKVVTGISTGALTAPFAFLGSAYDQRLREVYTSVTTDKIAKSRGLLAAVFDDALMDTTPLRGLLDSIVDDQMLAAIAREYARGRLLLIATTNLDSGRAVIWNIGVIAATGKPEAYRLIRKILIASAAIPAAFPPVMIDVEADGKKYQEMHVDGGATAQVFLYPPTLRLRSAAAAAGVERDRHAYVIRNGRLDPNWSQVQRRTLSIAGRAISALIQAQGVGDLYRIYIITQRDGVDFNLTYIPSSFNAQPAEDFDPVYMSKLFDVGYNAATAGTAWTKRPPGLLEEEPDKSAGGPPR